MATVEINCNVAGSDGILSGNNAHSPRIAGFAGNETRHCSRKIRKLCGRNYKSAEQAAIITFPIVGISANCRIHVERCRRKKPGVVDQSVEKRVRHFHGANLPAIRT